MNTREELIRLARECDTIGEAQAINRCLDELDRLDEYRRWYDGGCVGPKPQIVAAQAPATSPEPPDATALVEWLYQSPQSRCIVITASPCEVQHALIGKHPSDLAFRFRTRIPEARGTFLRTTDRVVEATTIVRDFGKVDSVQLAESLVDGTRLSLARFVEQQAAREASG